MKRFLIALLLIVAALGFAWSYKPSTPPSSELSKTLQATVDDHFPRLQIPGLSIALMTPDNQLLTVTKGVANVHTGDIMTPEHRFRLASISKHLTAILALKLAEQTPLSLDDNASDYLDMSHVPGGAQVTLRQLLTNTSGLSDYLNGDNDFFSIALNHPNKRWQLDEILSYAEQEGPEFAPGADYGYSNTGFWVLGRALEKAGGASLKQLFQQYIASPAGVHSVFPDEYSDAGMPVWLLAENERAYEYHRDGVGAAGNFVGEPAALVRLAHHAYQGPLLSQRQRETLLTPTVHTPNYALGTRLWDDLGFFHYGHTGTLSGYKSILVHIPKIGVTFSVHANGYAHEGDHWWALIDALFRDIVMHYAPEYVVENLVAETDA